MFEGPVISEVLDNGEVTDGTHVAAGSWPWLPPRGGHERLHRLGNNTTLARTPWTARISPLKEDGGQRSPDGRHISGLQASKAALQSAVDTFLGVDSGMAAALLDAVTTAALDAALSARRTPARWPPCSPRWTDFRLRTTLLP